MANGNGTKAVGRMGISNPKGRHRQPTMTTKMGPDEQPVLEVTHLTVPMPEHADVDSDNHPSIRDVNDRVTALFSALGTEAMPDTVFPTGQANKNNSKEAAEFALADRLRKLATDRFDAAKEAAEKAGVFGNMKELVPNETSMTWQCPFFTVSIKVGKPTEAINREATEVAADKYLGKKAEEFMAECKKARAPNKQIIVSMK